MTAKPLIAPVRASWISAFANLARGFRLIGEPGKAVVAARKATELDPDLGEGWLQFGFALATLGRHEEALPVLRNAVARTPENIDLFMGIGAPRKHYGIIPPRPRRGARHSGCGRIAPMR